MGKIKAPDQGRGQCTVVETTGAMDSTIQRTHQRPQIRRVMRTGCFFHTFWQVSRRNAPPWHVLLDSSHGTSLPHGARRVKLTFTGKRLLQLAHDGTEQLLLAGDYRNGELRLIGRVQRNDLQFVFRPHRQGG